RPARRSCKEPFSPASRAGLCDVVVIRAPAGKGAARSRCSVLFGRPSDVDGRVADSPRAVAELTVEVVAPARHLPAFTKRARVYLARAHRDRVVQAAHVHGRVALSRRAVAELTVEVVAPARHL